MLLGSGYVASPLSLMSLDLSPGWAVLPLDKAALTKSKAKQQVRATGTDL